VPHTQAEARPLNEMAQCADWTWGEIGSLRKAQPRPGRTSHSKGGHVPIDYSRKLGPQASSAAAPELANQRPRKAQAESTRARRRWTLVAVAIGAVGIAVGVMIIRPQLADPILPDRYRTAQGVQLPEPAQGGAVITYVRGKGAPILAYARAVPASLEGSEPDNCAGLTKRLTAVGAPPRLANSGGAAPDPSIRDAAATSLDRVALFLGQCQRGRVEDQVRHDAEFSTTVLRRMLDPGATA